MRPFENYLGEFQVFNELEFSVSKTLFSCLKLDMFIEAEIIKRT